MYWFLEYQLYCTSGVFVYRILYDILALKENICQAKPAKFQFAEKSAVGMNGHHFQIVREKPPSNAASSLEERGDQVGVQLSPLLRAV